MSEANVKPGESRAAEVKREPSVSETGEGEHHFAVDFGSVSTTGTLNLPSRMSFSFAFTFVITAAGTLPSNVPSGASSEPLCFISDYWP